MEVLLPGMSKNNSPIFLSLDLETTGFDPDQDKILEVGLFKFTLNEKGEVVELGSFSQLVNPGCDIPADVQIITNIKPEDVADQPEFSKIEKDIAEKIKTADYILGHNVGFDLSFLKKYLTDQLPPSLDSQLFAEMFFPGLPSYSLDVIPFELKLEKGEAHRALPDAKASAEVFAASVRQLAALPKFKKEILALSKNANLEELSVFQFAEKINNKKLWKPHAHADVHAKIIADIKNAVGAKINLGKQIITYSHINSADVSAATGLRESGMKKILWAGKEALTNEKGFVNVPAFDRLICLPRLTGLAEKQNISRNEAILGIKLLAAQNIGPTWPRISKEERFYLPSILLRTQLCKKHNCPDYSCLKLLNDKEFTAYISHYDLWSLEDISPDTELLITDFDEAAEALMKKMEIKLSLDYLPKIILTAPSLAENNKVESLKNEVVAKNDLFWGILNINTKNILTEEIQIHLTPELRQEYEFEKILSAAKSLTKSLDALIFELQKIEDDYILSYAIHLQKVRTDWEEVLTQNSAYHMYLENKNNNLIIHAYPAFSFIEKKFNSALPDNVILTASTNADLIANHYLNILGIRNWPLTTVDISKPSLVEFYVIKSSSNPIETTLKLLLENKTVKNLIVAKNAKEVSLLNDHLTRALGDKITIFGLDGARGGGKAIHGFTRAKKAILIIPPRGKILDIPWPKIELAIVSSIPFPAPEAHADFMSSGFPKAMLAQKRLVSKILKAGQGDLKLFLLDSRLTMQKYGQSFISLTENLCGNPPEYRNL